MLAAIALTPSAPVLVPDLAGAAATEVAALTAAACAAAATLPDYWVAIGVGSTQCTIAPDTRGNFAGYGVDLPVALSDQSPATTTAMPLCALIAGWLRGQVNTSARVRVCVFADDLDAATAADRGRRLRAEIDQLAHPIGVLVVADGVNTLTASAPGGHDPDSVAVQAGLDDALATADTDALMRLPDGVVGRVAYQVLAGLAPRPHAVEELLRAAPFGVGYFVGTWLPTPDTRP